MKDSKAYIDKVAPEHLSTKVISGALYIHNGKDVQEKVKRSEQVLNKIGSELASYAMALLALPQLMDNMRDSREYKEFADKIHTKFPYSQIETREIFPKNLQFKIKSKEFFVGHFSWDTL